MKPKELLDAALNRRAVTGVFGNARPIPAAFIVSMQFGMVMRQVDRMKLYTPKKKRRNRIDGSGIRGDGGSLI